MTKHRTYRPTRTVREYGYMDGQPVVQPGSPSGFLLPWDAIHEEAQAIVDRRAPMFVVAGEYENDQGIRFPELAVTNSHIEANTNYRYDRDTKTLRLLCPACGLRDGKHARRCEG